MTDDKTKIDASPSKQLFIEMLTRDVLLIPAILDVADNCIDGARRIRPDGSFKGLWVRITIEDDLFSISDNCGGIESEVARKYAFRFGRDADAPMQKHSVGRFGVGLKRAIFKMGTSFSIETIAPTSSFTMSVDVTSWAKKKEWAFEFSALEEGQKNRIAATGTTLRISPLHREVSASFEIPTFETELATEITSKLQDAIRKGLSISVNQTVIHADVEKLVGDKLAPAQAKRKFTSAGNKPVAVKLLCGLGESDDPDVAGWHIYCNGRLVLSGDKTPITGWESEGESVSIPGFHPQFNRFRGYAYFDSDDAGLLPWNTSKTAINADSTIYQAVRLDMIRLMRPVIDFCNQLKIEKEQTGDGKAGPLLKLLQASSLSAVASVATREMFTIPKVAPLLTKTGPTLQRISYDRPIKHVEAVKKALKARSYKEVGEETFDYFYNNEVKECVGRQSETSLTTF